MFKITVISFALISLVAILAAAWVWRPISATHPAIKNGNLPALIPLRDFYANKDSIFGHSISKDGSKLAWIEIEWFKRVLKIKDIKTGDITSLKTPKGSWVYYWSPNGNSIILNIDREGRELFEIAVRDIDNNDSEWQFFDLGKDAISFINFIPKTQTDKIIIANNKRNSAIFDLYNLDLKSGDLEPIGLQHDQQVTYVYDDSGKIIGRSILGEINSGNWVFEAGNSDENWKKVTSGNYNDVLRLFGNLTPNNTMYGLSNLNRDKSALISFDLSNGHETVIQQDDDVDIHSVYMDVNKDKLLMSKTYKEKVEHTFFDEEFKQKLALIDASPEADISFGSATNDLSKAIVQVTEPKSATTSYLLDLQNDKIERLAEAPLAKYKDSFSSYEGVQIEALDGLKIPAYLFRLKGVSGPIPTIIIVHGGPISRTYGSFESFYAMLNNRGYAVLDVNYRGSWGYGRKFAKAGKGEIAGKMSSDIIDARRWAVEQGITDPNKVGIFGISWGGFEVMTAVTQNSDLFAAAVNINGVTDLSTMLAEVPDYWRGWQEWLTEYGADPSTPQGLKYLQDRSPLYHADKMKTPLLIVQADNDVRVVQSQSDRLVAELKKHNAPYEYQLIKGVGHSPKAWPWQKRYLMTRDVEHFFAKHLGGRAGGYDYAILGAHILPE